MEAFLPGGSLDPPTRALNPIVACIGGVVGPVSMFFVLAYIFHAAGMYDSKHDYMDIARGWGIPTATDIALAWMVAMQVFKLPNGKIHPAINYLLLMAVIDDAIGLVIIAVFYTDPDHPVKPIWLLLLLGGSGLSYLLRRFKVKQWWLYLLIGGIPCWVSLLKAGVHPALTLIPVVPFMPDHIPDDGTESESESAGPQDEGWYGSMNPDRTPTAAAAEPNERLEINIAAANCCVTPPIIKRCNVELEQLSDDSRERFLNRVFQDMDIDHNGGLTVDEVQKVMKHVCHHDDQDMAHGEIELLFNAIHGDSEGQISFEEFVRWFGDPLTPKRLPCADPQQIERVMRLNDDLLEEVRKEAHHEEQSHLRYLKLVFEGMDIDHNGGLTVEEISKVMHKLGHQDEEMAHGEVEDLFMAIHGDTQGLISFEEFVRWSLCRKKDLDPESEPTERQRRDSAFELALSEEVEKALEEEKSDVLKGVFAELDVDHEDGLTVKEIIKVMHKLNPENDKDMAHDEVTHLFRQIHGDTQGKITFEEFRDWFDHKGKCDPAHMHHDPRLSAEECSRDSRFESKFRHSVHEFVQRKLTRRRLRPRLGQISWDSDGQHEVGHNKNGPLHGFAHACKTPVDIGLIMFSLCNAGAKVSEVGAMTVNVLVALVAGKVIGIMGFAKAAELTGKADIPEGVTTSDLWYVSLIASLGLTVALFVAGQAFTDESLEAQAKVGALLSGLVGFVAIGLRTVLGNPHWDGKEPSGAAEKASGDGKEPSGAASETCNGRPTIDTTPHWKDTLGLEACPDSPVFHATPKDTPVIQGVDLEDPVVAETQPDVGQAAADQTTPETQL